MDEDVLFVLGTPAPWAAAAVSAIAGAKLACSPSSRLAVVAAGQPSAAEGIAWKDTVVGLRAEAWAALPLAQPGAAAAAASAAAGIRGWLKSNASLVHCSVRAVVIADSSDAPVSGGDSGDLAAAVEALAAALRPSRCHVDCLVGLGAALKPRPGAAPTVEVAGDAPSLAGNATLAEAEAAAAAASGEAAADTAEATEAAVASSGLDCDAGAAPRVETGRSVPCPEEALLAAAGLAGGQPPVVALARSAAELWDACAVLASAPVCRCVGEGGDTTSIAVGSLVHKFSSARKLLSAPAL